jgi:hypothetical protein
MAYDQIPSKDVIETTIAALKQNNVDAMYFENREDTKNRVLELLPEGAEVLTMTSMTAEALDLPKEINESGKYDAVRNKLNSMDRATQSGEMQKLGAAPEYAIGSVHAVTQDGKVIIASMTGSQLPAYTYGSKHIIWVVGAQKIVKDLDDGMKRLYEHTLPLESERAKKAYGVPGSDVAKIFILNKEWTPGRITMVIIGEVLGF